MTPQSIALRFKHYRTITDSTSSASLDRECLHNAVAAGYRRSLGKMRDDFGLKTYVEAGRLAETSDAEPEVGRGPERRFKRSARSDFDAAVGLARSGVCSAVVARVQAGALEAFLPEASSSLIEARSNETVGQGKTYTPNPIAGFYSQTQPQSVKAKTA